MGLYNTIKTNPAQKCPKCGNELTDWQTKEISIYGYLLENLLTEIKLNSHMDGEIHTVCSNCQSFIELRIKKGKIFNPQPQKKEPDV